MDVKKKKTHDPLNKKKKVQGYKYF
jgi:hypothetical protein